MTSLELWSPLCPMAECAPMAVALSREFESAFGALVQVAGAREVSQCVLSLIEHRWSTVSARETQRHLCPAYTCSLTCCCSPPVARRAQPPSWLHATGCGNHLTETTANCILRQAT